MVQKSGNFSSFNKFSTGYIYIYNESHHGHVFFWDEPFKNSMSELYRSFWRVSPFANTLVTAQISSKNHPANKNAAKFDYIYPA